MSVGNYSSLDQPVAPKVVDSRRTIRVALEMDVPDEDWRRIVIPGEGTGEDASPPVDALEMIEARVRFAVQRALGDSHDLEVTSAKARLGAVHRYTKPTDF